MTSNDNPSNDNVGRMFTNLDGVNDAQLALAIAVLDQLAAQPVIRRVRAVAREALALRPGQRLLDAGAGVGEAARELAPLVEPDGEVIALDLSAALVGVAAQRHDSSPVHYAVGNVTKLDFPDASFDAVRSERVFQHLPDADAAVREFLRVLRPGGRLVLIDTDWESFLIDGVPVEMFNDLQRRAEAAGVIVPERLGSGRRLRGRLVRAGLHDVLAEPVTMALTDIPSVAAIHPAFQPEALRVMGIAPAEVLRPWTEAFEAAAQNGELLAVVTIWVASGVKPD